MSSAQAEHDYFFAIEAPQQSRDSNIELWAEGEGLGVIQAMSRQAFLDMVLIGEPSFSFYSRELAALTGSSHMGTGERSRALDTGQATCLYVSSSEVRALFNPTKEARDRFTTHEEARLEALRTGTRSVRNVTDEILEGVIDRHLINRAGHSWFNPGGYHLKHPTYRGYGLRVTAEPLALRTVQRRKSASSEEQLAREAFFKLVPEKAIGRAAQIASFRRLKDGSISDKPLTSKGLKTETIYGYVDATEFVPVYNRTRKTPLEN